MAYLEQNNTSNLATKFCEVERYNLFSQGNIYTTKTVDQPIRASLTADIGHGSTNLLVGTLKPPKILSIMTPNTESNKTSETTKEEGISIKILFCTYKALLLLYWPAHNTGSPLPQ